jgi:alpha,alpha-trehalose phosphorylase
MRTGTLTRHVRWMTPSGKDVVIDFERMVSFEERTSRSCA